MTAVALGIRQIGRRGRLAGALLALTALAGCHRTTIAGESDSYLILTALQAASGAEPTKLAGVLSSDVVTMVKQTVNDEDVFVPTVFADGAQATFKLGLKDPGTGSTPNTPTTTNFITVTRYHVEFSLADGGGGVPGVNVPVSFDGAATGTVTDSGGAVSFTLVRVEQKEAAPLLSLVNGGALPTIAKVTFTGVDQAGRPTSVVGLISVNFANWADPR